MDDLILGIDAGGSKTVSLLADSKGRILGRGKAGACAFQALPEADVRQALRESAAAAFADAHLTSGPAAMIGIGLSGVDRPGDHQRVQRVLHEEGLGERAVIVNDSELLLWCGELQGWGIAVVSGTGSIVFGRNQQGKTERAGGWGYRFGDEGSGFAIGTAALRAVCRATDGRGPRTALTNLLLAFWGLQSPVDLIPHIYKTNMPYAKIAQLAPLVDAAAKQGDAPAIAILEEAAVELAQAVAAVYHRLGVDGPAPAAFGGGVLLHSDRVRRTLIQHAAGFGISLQPLALAEEPAAGAVRMALHSFA